LFTYLAELEDYGKKTNPDSVERMHLDKLTEFLRTHYASVREKLSAHLEHKEITFELLPVFLRPNSIVYMKDALSEQPRCFIFDSGQTKTFDNRKWFEMNCRYLTHDGKSFGEATAATRISEFYGVIKITSLGVYPLKYHAEKDKIAEQLTERGRKFLSLMGMHCRTYRGMASYQEKKDKVRKFHVKGRVIIDAVSFREKNPNYFFQNVNQNSSQDNFSGFGFPLDDYDSSSDDSSCGIDGEVIKRRASYTKAELILCNPTVFGFDLPTKQWGLY